MTFETCLTMVIYMAICSFTPGPGNILVLNTMTKYGWNEGKRVLFGICCGYLCVQWLCTAAVYGLNQIMTSALLVLKYVGGGYLLWLAYHIAVSGTAVQDKTGSPTFRSGFLLQMVNVKIYFYITSLLSGYFLPYMDSIPLLLTAGLGAVGIGSLASFSWAFLGLKIQKVYENYNRPINIALAFFLIYCAWNMIQ